MENLEIQQMSTFQTLLWYFASVFGSLLIYAYMKVRQKPEENFSLKTFFRQNALRLYLGLGVTAFFSAIMFSPEASTFLANYFPIKVSPASPIAFGAAIAAFLITGIRADKSGNKHLPPSILPPAAEEKEESSKPEVN
jgi:uncharacterized BrkB/YihY/UPF0761 family membrane protein